MIGDMIGCSNYINDNEDLFEHIGVVINGFFMQRK